MGDTCVNCHDPVGEEAKELPFKVMDGAKSETWCPQCFVYTRAPMEPWRFYPGSFGPTKCGRCGFTSVDCGQFCCNQCGSRAVVVLPPKPHALQVPAPAGPSAPIEKPKTAKA